MTHELKSQSPGKETGMTALFTRTRKIAALCAVALGLPAAVAAQEACTTYDVRVGDTLGTIAFAAYGTYDYQIIFNANRTLVGSNPNNVAVGTQLTLPCADGALIEGQSLENIIQQQQAANPTTTSSNGYQPPVKFLAGSNYAPFSDEAMEGGGFLSILAQTALQRAGNSRENTLAFVNDWGAHLDILLPTGAFDVGLGWYMPDCAKVDMLSDSMARRCNEFLGSVPVYEPVVAYYAASGSKYANATSFDDLRGARVCRMDGYFTHDFEEEGIADDITYVRPTLPEECIEAVLLGTADVAGMELQSGSDAITKLGVSSEVVEIPSLAKVLKMTFMTHKSNPFGRQYIVLLNRGLNEMRKTGEWYAIVSGSLAEHNAMILSQ
jgi:ABC-type amino acid transport substrate-binding protein